MKEKRDGKPFEILVKLLHEALRDVPGSEVLHNQRLPNKNGSRTGQIDVLVKIKSAGENITIAIECKNYNGPVPAQRVDGFAGKCRRLAGIDKVVMVSAQGFQAGAFDAAREHHVSLRSLSDISADTIKEWIEFETVRMFNVSKEIVDFYITYVDGRKVYGKGDSEIADKSFIIEKGKAISPKFLILRTEYENLPAIRSNLAGEIIQKGENRAVNNELRVICPMDCIPPHNAPVVSIFEDIGELAIARIDFRFLYTLTIHGPDSFSVKQYKDLLKQENKADVFDAKIDGKNFIMIRPFGSEEAISYLIDEAGNPTLLTKYPDPPTS